jgi:Protein of unknown function (DUF2778)
LTNTHTLSGALSHDRGRLLAYSVLGAGALSLGLLASWHGFKRPVAPEPLVQAMAPAPAVNPYAPMVVGLGPWARAAIAANEAATSAQQSAALAQPAPDTLAEADAGADVPLPPRRPGDLKTLANRMAPPPIRQAALPAEPAPASAPADNRGFFEKIFGGAEQQAAVQPQPAPVGRGARGRQQVAAQQPAQTQALAYAAAEPAGGLFGGITSPAAPTGPAQQSVAVGPAPRPGAGTAVYDISTHTVHMPDGTRLEAHSGLREYLDDPRFVHVRMRGPTPPSVYSLTPREALFHGVEALRLTPVGGAGVFGRAGLLAHTYMLGPNGDSNGCVSFRDYNAFLQAYKRGEVRRLVVVARM